MKPNLEYIDTQGKGIAVPKWDGFHVWLDLTGFSQFEGTRYWRIMWKLESSGWFYQVADFGHARPQGALRVVGNREAVTIRAYPANESEASEAAPLMAGRCREASDEEVNSYKWLGFECADFGVTEVDVQIRNEGKEEFIFKPYTETNIREMVAAADAETKKLLKASGVTVPIGQLSTVRDRGPFVVFMINGKVVSFQLQGEGVTIQPGENEMVRVESCPRSPYAQYWDGDFVFYDVNKTNMVVAEIMCYTDPDTHYCKPQDEDNRWVVGEMEGKQPVFMFRGNQEEIGKRVNQRLPRKRFTYKGTGDVSEESFTVEGIKVGDHQYKVWGVAMAGCRHCGGTGRVAKDAFIASASETDATQQCGACMDRYRLWYQANVTDGASLVFAEKEATVSDDAAVESA